MSTHYTTTGPSIDICINWQKCSGSKRHRSLQRMRFIVENDRSTVAVATGSSNSFLAAAENAGNIAALSADTVRLIKLSGVARVSGSLRKMSHLLYNSLDDVSRTLATLVKSTVSAFSAKMDCNCTQQQLNIDIIHFNIVNYLLFAVSSTNNEN